MPTVASMSYARMADATDTSITARRSFSSSECRKVPNDNFAQTIEQKWAKNGGSPLRIQGNPGAQSLGPMKTQPNPSGRPPAGRDGRRGRLASGLTGSGALCAKIAVLNWLECGGLCPHGMSEVRVEWEPFGPFDLCDAHPTFPPKIPLFCPSGTS